VAPRRRYRVGMGEDAAIFMDLNTCKIIRLLRRKLEATLDG